MQERITTGFDCSITEQDVGTILGPKLKRKQLQGLQKDRYIILISSRASMCLGSAPVPVGTYYRNCIGSGSIP